MKKLVLWFVWLLLFTTTTFAVVIKVPSYCKNPVNSSSSSDRRWYFDRGMDNEWFDYSRDWMLNTWFYRYIAVNYYAPMAMSIDSEYYILNDALGYLLDYEIEILNKINSKYWNLIRKISPKKQKLVIDKIKKIVRKKYKLINNYDNPLPYEEEQKEWHYINVLKALWFALVMKDYCNLDLNDKVKEEINSQWEKLYNSKK